MIYTKIYSILGASVSGWVPTSGKSDAHWGHSDWPWRLSSGSLSKRKGKLRHLWKKGLLKYFGSQWRRRGDSGNADNFCVGSGDYLAPVVKPRKPSLKKLVFLGHPIEQEWFCYEDFSCFCYGFLLWIFAMDFCYKKCFCYGKERGGWAGVMWHQHGASGLLGMDVHQVPSRVCTHTPIQPHTISEFLVQCPLSTRYQAELHTPYIQTCNNNNKITNSDLHEIV